jgi:hypothetical protein
MAYTQPRLELKTQPMFCRVSLSMPMPNDLVHALPWQCMFALYAPCNTTVKIVKTSYGPFKEGKIKGGGRDYDSFD